MPASRFRHLLLAAALLWVALAAAPLHAETAVAGFTDSFAVTEQGAVALAKLTVTEKSALDRLVARDLASARQGGVTSFRGTFSSRRTPEERGQAGLEKLSADELAQLDTRVADTLALRPLLVLRTPRPPDPAGIDVRTALKPELHGRVTLGYGWSEGGSYRFGSVETYYYDPESRVGVGFGLSTVNGRGYFRY